MAVAGRKPREDRSQVRHRVKPRHEWTEVEDKPYTGPRPSLPRRRGGWPTSTRRWWETIREMPHCILWTKADWQFALDTAEVHARWTEDGKGATELRIRESRMGTTLDARRDLRIRYVPATDKAADKAKATDTDPKVVSMNDYRDI